MAIYSLPLEKNNVDIPPEYCYLALKQYSENDFIKPQQDKNKPTKKLTSQELKDKKESILRQQNTIKQLDTGYCNLHNCKYDLDTILNSFFISHLDNSNCLIYKIQPLASYKNRTGYSYNDKYETSEFNVLTKFNSKEEVINQIYKDGLLRKFASVLFDSLSYINEGYDLKLYKYFEYFKNTFSDYDISLSDIVLSNKNKFDRKDIYEIIKTNIRYLLENDLIKCFREDDYYKEELITLLIECGLSEIALQCVKLLEEYNIKSLLNDKEFDRVLRKWSTDKHVKMIIDILGIKLSGITLTVKDINESSTVETKLFDNIGEVKTYLIKNYNISFDEIVNKDICDIESYNENEDINYRFEIN